jgi:hypothetical protein
MNLGYLGKPIEKLGNSFINQRPLAEVLVAWYCSAFPTNIAE